MNKQHFIITGKRNTGKSTTANILAGKNSSVVFDIDHRTPNDGHLVVDEISKVSHLKRLVSDLESTNISRCIFVTTLLPRTLKKHFSNLFETNEYIMLVCGV